MMLNVYSIHDSAAKAFTQPFFMQTDGMAIRAFQAQVNSKEDNNIKLNPDHFTLYRIGQFNDLDGALYSRISDSDSALISLGNGQQFVENAPVSELQHQMHQILQRIEETIQRD